MLALGRLQDFGFILGISPGGVVFNDILTAGFETSPFVLKREMVQIMGGSLESAPFQWFTQLVVKGFLAARYAGRNDTDTEDRRLTNNHGREAVKSAQGLT